MFKIIVSPLAREDFFEIFEYIVRDNRDAAARFSDALLNHIEQLATFPHLGVQMSNRSGVRSILHTPVRICYRVDDKRESVEVIHFRHAARQQPKF